MRFRSKARLNGRRTISWVANRKPRLLQHMKLATAMSSRLHVRAHSVEKTPTGLQAHKMLFLVCAGRLHHEVYCVRMSLPHASRFRVLHRARTRYVHSIALHVHLSNDSSLNQPSSIPRRRPDLTGMLCRNLFLPA